MYQIDTWINTDINMPYEQVRQANNQMKNDLMTMFVQVNIQLSMIDQRFKALEEKFEQLNRSLDNLEVTYESGFVTISNHLDEVTHQIEKLKDHTGVGLV